MESEKCHHSATPILGNRPRASSTPKIPKRTLPFDEPNHKHRHRHHESHETKPNDDVNHETNTIHVDHLESTPRHIQNIDLRDAEKQFPADQNFSTTIPLEDSETKAKRCTPKIQSSFVLCCGFLCFGSSMAIIGPTILELGCLTGEDVGAMSWVFFAQTCSALLGAIGSGIITDRFQINYNVFLAVVISIHALALIIIPFMRVLGTLLIFTSMHGLFGGFQDTATNLRMIIMHGQDVPPYLQTLFFFYGVGAFLSPIIAGNFLSDECNRGSSDGLSDFGFSRRRRHNGIGMMPHWVQQINKKGIMLTSNTSTTKSDNIALQADIIRITSTRVHYAYIVVAMIHITVTVGLWYLFVVERRRREELSQSTFDGSTSVSTDPLEDSATRSERSDVDPAIKTQVYCISFWIAIMVFISDGLQGSFGSYIYTYAVKSNIGISVDDAAYLNSLFWGALAFGRLLAIFVSMYVSPRIMLLVDVAGCLLSIVLMFLFRFQLVSLWVGTATFGLCLSNIFPTSVSMAESYFRLTGTITCIFVVCSGLGEMAIPLLIGKLFDVIGPISFLAISCILCFLSVGTYVAVVITGKGIEQKQLELEKSFSAANSPLNLSIDQEQTFEIDEEFEKKGEEEIVGTSSPKSKSPETVTSDKKSS